MAKLKTAKNLIQNRDEYARFFTGFRGVDFSSDHTEVADSRFAYLVNMYKDYKSGEGGAVETIPGYRRVYEVVSEGSSIDNKIFGVHTYGKYRLIHAGNKLISIDVMPVVESRVTSGRGVDINKPGIVRDFITGVTVNGVKAPDWHIEEYEDGEYITVSGIEINNGAPAVITQGVVSPEMAFKTSTSIFFGGRLYIFDGKHIFWWDGKKDIHNIEDDAYIPTTHELIYPGTDDPDIAPGVEMEQRNILTPKYKNKFIAGLNSDLEPEELPEYHENEFQLKYGSDYEIQASESYCSTDSNPIFPEHVAVYQYGVKLPMACGYWGAQTNLTVPKGFPNAIDKVTKDGLVRLVNAPPAPELNTWNPDKKTFDYTKEEIKEGKPDYDGYQWPFAYASTYDGIEIIAENAVTNINGIEAKSGYASIITHCTIATVFDNRIFLSGNPEFPTHIFWSALNGETSYPDPTYFGITNNDIEGVTNSPVTAMIPVADQLMVLKKENASEGSVIFHTPTETGENVSPKIYPSTQGLPGRGCLGAACNFLDDPVFISRLGLEAMGQLSARYERAIEHRSSLIDAKLLTLDLERAQLVEYEGYLLVLVDGKIFMADSRQTFTHESGVMQYEWYYLENIGVWEGQYDECVFARLPVWIEPDAIFDSLGGEGLCEADAVRDELGREQNLIGQTAYTSVSEIRRDDKYGFYYKKIPWRDEYGRETGGYQYCYVEPTGAKIGGDFVPAERLYVIGSDLYFSAGKHLCKFNFDKRDKTTGIIPVEYYNFDGRKIFSGCATKMDNCGIPHLVKNTVKRSTVIKTRVFTHSFAKIKVRTNRKAFEQVGRIINGTEVFDGTSFADYTFNVDGKTLFSINEKEKKWVEKQHFIYSDGYCEPFAIHYLAYRYNVAGRYKEK